MRVTSKVQTTAQPTIFSERQPLTVARVELDNGASVTFSRYDDEDAWYADAAFSDNGMPLFVHGEGERTTMKRPATDDVAAAIEAAPIT